jgi:hypothetical protein
LTDRAGDDEEKDRFAMCDRRVRESMAKDGEVEEGKIDRRSSRRPKTYE